MARKMNNRTQGLKNFVQQALNQLEAGNVQEAKYTLMNIGGTEMEIRMANQSDVEAFKANKRSLYDK